MDVEEVDMFAPDGIKRGMADNVMSVPAVLIDRKSAFVGFPFSEEALVISIEEALKR
jgi:hypothetical protein